MEDSQNMRTGIFCSCGQRIYDKDVVHRSYYLRRVGSNFVYIRYRCPRCKRLGEQFIRQERWDERLLRGEANELTPSEKERVEKLGPITVDEMIDFHEYLEQDPSLKLMPDK